MAYSDDSLISEQAAHPTAPKLDIPAAGLPERPDVTDAELRAGADALTGQWQMLGPGVGGGKQGGLPERLKRLAARLKDRLAAAKSIANTK